MRPRYRLGPEIVVTRSEFQRRTEELYAESKGRGLLITDEDGKPMMRMNEPMPKGRECPVCESFIDQDDEGAEDHHVW